MGPPPHDLDERELPIARLEGPWFRLHAAGRDPVFFGRTGLNRFDDPEGEFGVLYMAEDSFEAFIEVYGWDPGLNLVRVDLSIGACNCQQLTPEEFLRCRRFIDVDVRTFRTDDGVV